MTWLEQLKSVNWGQVAAYTLGAYVLGCFVTGYYLVRALKGMDIRNVNSGSVGARNVSQVLGWRGFVATILGDAAKGVLAVWAARHLTGDGRLAGLVMLAVVVGHIWPAHLCFRGGKGVATSIAALLIYDWRLALTYGVLFLGGFVLTRRTIMPGLLGYVCLPLAAWWLDHDALNSGIVAFLAALVLIAHWRNIVEEFPALAARCGMAAKPEQPKL